MFNLTHSYVSQTLHEMLIEVHAVYMTWIGKVKDNKN